MVATGDGALGFWKARAKIYPDALSGGVIGLCSEEEQTPPRGWGAGEFGGQVWNIC